MTKATKAFKNGLGSRQPLLQLGNQCTALLVTAATGLSLAATPAALANGLSFTNYTSSNSGLANDFVYAVYASGTNIYAGSRGGLSISTNGGTNWTTTNLGWVRSVYASGSSIYAGTQGGGLNISTNGGTNWTNYTTTNGLGSNTVFGVYASGSNVYAATRGGLSVSTNNGTNWTNYTTTNGLGSNNLWGVYASDGNVYAATEGGLSIASDPNPVPAPLPVLGSAAALGFCRRLRSRSKRLRHAPTPRLA